MLPLFYDMANYSECVLQKNQFCIADMSLEATSPVSSAWRKIVDLQKNRTIFDRGLLHRGLCLPKSLNFNAAKEHAKMVVNQNLESYNLTSTTKYIACSKNEVVDLNNDYIILSVYITIFLLTILATVMNILNRKPQNFLEKLLMQFSVIKNWKHVTRTDGTRDFAKLKSVQGLRVIVMILIIYKHANIKAMNIFVDEVEEIEKFMQHTLLQVLATISVFLVNIFFMISSFLLANQIYKITEQNGKFSIKDVLIIVINRYFRFFFVITAVMSISRLRCLQTFVGPSSLRFWTATQEACQKSWIYTALYLNNFFYIRDTCYGISWYLSVDFQAYVLITLLLYIIIRFKLNEWIVTISCFIASMIFHGVVIYIYDMDIIFRAAYLRDFDPVHFQQSRSFLISYTSTYSNIATSIIGMVSGIIYFKTKYNDVNCNEITVLKWMWKILSLGMPILAIVLSMKRYNKLMTAIIGSLVRPLFASGFAITILGMSFGLGGNMKKFLEWKYFVIFSNISFCTYLSNFFTLIFGGTSISTLITFDVSLLFKEFGNSLIISVITGLILTLMIELPGISIQKMLLPQIEKDTRYSQKKM